MGETKYMYVSTSVDLAESLDYWDDPQSLEVNSQVIALTGVFTCVIYFFGFCCGSFFIYKLRFRLPVQHQNQFELPDYSRDQGEAIEVDMAAFATPMSDKDGKLAKKK
jgi:hypothetical protein